MGFISQKGTGLLASTSGIVIACIALWNADSITEVQRYFGILSLIMTFAFVFLLIVVDYNQEELKKEIAIISDKKNRNDSETDF